MLHVKGFMDRKSRMPRHIDRNAEGLVVAMNAIQNFSSNVDHEYACVEIVPDPLGRNTILLRMTK